MSEERRAMHLTLFSVEEANRTAAELRPRIQRLVEAKREFDALGRRLDVLALALADASPDNPDARERAAARTHRAALGQELTRGLQVVHARGCVVKDLDKGLVDFYALAGDRLVFLCWHVGEPEVAHWHGLHEGYAGRQPLDRLERE